MTPEVPNGVRGSVRFGARSARRALADVTQPGLRPSFGHLWSPVFGPDLG